MEKFIFSRELPGVLVKYTQKSPAEAGLLVLAKDTYLLVVTCTPGPIVELMVMLLRYTPLEVLGFTRRMVSSTALAFSASLAASKEALPIAVCTMP